MKKLILNLFILFLFIFTNISIARANNNVPIPTTGAYFGLWASDASGQSNSNTILELATLLSKKPILIPMSWGNENMCSQNLSFLESKMELFPNSIPMINLGLPRSYSEIITNTINTGDTRPFYQIKPDDFWISWADGLKAYGKPVFLRFFSEMNWNSKSSSFSYYVCTTCVDPETKEPITPEIFIKAWRHIHDIFKNEGATNVSFMWIVEPYYHGFHNTVDYVPFYPGDDYVDWVGMDVYNCDPIYHSTIKELLKPDYDALHRLAPNKPIIIPEFNSQLGTDLTGQTRAQWFTQILTDLPNEYPIIKGIALFNVAGMENPPHLTRIQDGGNIGAGDTVVAAFKKAIASQYYISSIFSPTPTSTPTSIPTTITCVPYNDSTKTTLNNFSIWRSEYISGNFGSLSKDNWQADFDCDHKVTLNDFSIWRAVFLKNINGS